VYIAVNDCVKIQLKSKCDNHTCMCLSTTDSTIENIYVIHRYRNPLSLNEHTILATIINNNLTIHINLLLDTGALQSN